MTRRRVGLAGLLVVLAGSALAGLGQFREVIGTGGASRGEAVVVDADGTSFVAGDFQADATSPVLPFISRYDAWGLLQWTLTQFGTSGSTGYGSAALAVALLPVSGTVYDVLVGGRVWSGTTTGLDAFLARLGADGTPIWMVVNQQPGWDEAIHAIAVAKSGAIWAAGRWESGGYGQPWVDRFDGSGTPQVPPIVLTDFNNTENAALGLAVDASGSVYVAGVRAELGNGYDAFLTKITPGSVQQWTITFDGGVGSTDFATSVAVAPGGDLVVVGGAFGPGTRTDSLIARVSAGGSVLWARTLDGGEKDDDWATACAIASDGTIYVTGGVDRATGVFSDIWLATLDTGGNVLSELDRNYGGNYVDRGLGLALGPAGRVWVVGEITDASNVRRMILTEYMPVSAPSTAPVVVEGVAAMPNPFRPRSGGPQDAAGITFRTVPAGAAVRVYTLRGTLVADLVDTDADGIIVWNGKDLNGDDAVSGIYAYVVKPTSGAISRGKVVIIR